MNLSALSSSKITFKYWTDKNKEETVDFVVNSNYLYSAEGLSGLFTTCRLAFLGDKSEDPTEPWDSWHLIGVQESTDCFVLVHEDLLTSISA